MCITIGAPERMKLGTPTSLFMLQIFRTPAKGDGATTARVIA